MLKGIAVVSALSDGCGITQYDNPIGGTRRHAVYAAVIGLCAPAVKNHYTWRVHPLQMSGAGEFYVMIHGVELVT